MNLSISELHPVNREYGVYQGVPVARHYIDRYFERIAGRIRGKVLEFGSPTYAARLHCDYEIIDVDRNNPRADIFMDICDETVSSFRPSAYDFIICTSVLQLVSDPQKAVDNMYRMLKPGGVLIVAEKSISKIDSWSGDLDRWRFTPAGLRRLVSGFSNVDLESYGNVYVICAYLLGLPAKDLQNEKLDYVDPEHPLLSIVYAEK